MSVIPFWSFGFFFSSTGDSSFPTSSFTSPSPSSDEALLSESPSSLLSSASLFGAPNARGFLSLVNDSPALANDWSFPNAPPPPNGEPGEAPKPLLLVDARAENGDALDAWLKFSVGFWTAASVDGFLKVAPPKADPLEEPPKAEKGDADVAKLEREELAKVRVGFEGTASAVSALPVNLEACGLCQ